MLYCIVLYYIMLYYIILCSIIFYSISLLSLLLLFLLFLLSSHFTKVGGFRFPPRVAGAERAESQAGARACTWNKAATTTTTTTTTTITTITTIITDIVMKHTGNKTTGELAETLPQTFDLHIETNNQESLQTHCGLLFNAEIKNMFLCFLRILFFMFFSVI